MEFRSMKLPVMPGEQHCDQTQPLRPETGLKNASLLKSMDGAQIVAMRDDDITVMKKGARIFIILPCFKGCSPCPKKEQKEQNR